ncbi:MAG: hypothetical protein DDT18_00764 [Actinobacteria bacterium]|uniref:hypothetical protein n=1 Tax=Candidatus Hakubella thermalkaliphila TaxID=2754717 RepID=UPI0015939923|nr:hypothetical protein [Candidatus Hakubella thermalkaliphila]MBT9170423.1 hypothetical protein [Actinomycetota bacterium]
MSREKYPPFLKEKAYSFPLVGLSPWPTRELCFGCQKDIKDREDHLELVLIMLIMENGVYEAR